MAPVSNGQPPIERDWTLAYTSAWHTGTGGGDAFGYSDSGFNVTLSDSGASR